MIGVQIANLNAKINILAPESTSYLEIRNRFFSTYTNSKDGDAVPVGNLKAHAGDIITDRRLYENGGTRFDDETFEDLYGIQWGSRAPKWVRFLLSKKNCGNLTPGNRRRCCNNKCVKIHMHQQ